MTSARYRAVLFDLDGTLVDSYDALTEAINYARRPYSMQDLNRTEVQQFVGDGVEKLLQRVFAPFPVPQQAWELFESRYDQICCQFSTVLTDVEATLDSMGEDNTRMAVCTNKPTSFSRKILEHLGIARHFDAIIGPDLAGARKPDPRHVLFTLESTGVGPAEALFVGDMPVDVAAARASGLDVAVIATGSASPRELRDSQPDFFLKRFPELVEVVKHGVLATR
jgi:phosphoglycolate phosphatase